MHSSVWQVKCTTHAAKHFRPQNAWQQARIPHSPPRAHPASAGSTSRTKAPSHTACTAGRRCQSRPATGNRARGRAGGSGSAMQLIKWVGVPCTARQPSRSQTETAVASTQQHTCKSNPGQPTPVCCAATPTRATPTQAHRVQRELGHGRGSRGLEGPQLHHPVGHQLQLGHAGHLVQLVQRIQRATLRHERGSTARGAGCELRRCSNGTWREGTCGARSPTWLCTSVAAAAAVA